MSKQINFMKNNNMIDNIKHTSTSPIYILIRIEQLYVKEYFKTDFVILFHEQNGCSVCCKFN